jgi:PleD family two-component response regulator
VVQLCRAHKFISVVMTPAFKMSAKESMAVHHLGLKQLARLGNPSGRLSMTRSTPSPRLAAHLGSTQPQLVLSGVRVLYAEDCKTTQLAVQWTLKRLGAECTTVSDGQSALTLFERSMDAFDVLLMDCNMPVMDGWTATLAIRLFETARHKVREKASSSFSSIGSLFKR